MPMGIDYMRFGSDTEVIQLLPQCTIDRMRVVYK